MRHLYACNAGPLEFCQYPYTPKRGLPYGMEPQTVTLMDDGTLRLYVYQTLVKTIEVSFLLEEMRYGTLYSFGRSRKLGCSSSGAAGRTLYHAMVF